MTLQQETRTVGSRGVSRRFLAAVIGLPILLAGACVAWWLSQPALEPLPSVSTRRMAPEIRSLIDSAAANVVLSNRSAAAWGDLGAVFFVHQFEAPSQVCFRNAERLDSRDYRWPYLLGVSSGRLIFTTPKYIRAVNAASGGDEDCWQTPADPGYPGLPSYGRGFLAGDYVFWPTRDGVRVLCQAKDRKSVV